jgi:membrane associated rhomboid family serine protease
MLRHAAMAARVCPHCRQLNGASEVRCFRCGRRLPGKFHDAVTRLTSDVLGSEAPVTRLLLALELLVFALCVLLDRRFPLWFSDAFRGSTLVRLGALGGPLGGEEPFRLLSAVFLHANVLHVGMNMMMFVDLGRKLEAEIGGARAALLFILSGVLGFVASELWYGPMGPLTVGASGGVFGQIGAVVGILYARRDPEWRRALVRNLVFAALLAFVFSVNTAAHLGGFVAGIVCGFLLHEERRRFDWGRTMTALAVLAVVGSVASVGLSSRSPVWQSFRAYEMLHE